MRPSSSEQESVGSHDTGIDLNPDDVPVGYHPSADRLLAHRRRSRSVAASRSAAAADSVPRVIDADDESDDSSDAGKDTASSNRQSKSRSASFDKTVEWLMTRTGSKCPAGQFHGPHDASLSRSSSHVYDAHSCDDAAANSACDEAVLPDISHSRQHSPSQCSSSHSACLSQSECAADENASTDNLNLGLHHRVVSGATSAAEQVVNSDVADYKHRREVQGSRQTLMNFAGSDSDMRNRRRSEQKVSFHELLDSLF